MRRTEHESQVAPDALAPSPVNPAHGVTTTPRPSCCVVCCQPLAFYASCGSVECVAELLRRQSRGVR